MSNDIVFTKENFDKLRALLKNIHHGVNNGEDICSDVFAARLIVDTTFDSHIDSVINNMDDADNVIAMLTESVNN